MSVRLVTVDAFTNTPFGGNPAAVCVLPETKPDSWLRQVAREMNLSETAFVVPNGREFDLRWLTPVVEVTLCGHATIASAHVLWEDGHLPLTSQARFRTRSGLLTADRRGGWIELDLPAKATAVADPPPGLLAALGVALPLAVTKHDRDFLIEINSEEAVRSLRPDHRALRTLAIRGVIVTSRSLNPEFDFISRFFAPGSGVDEDPVTGSAHTALGPYWGAKLGKSSMTAYQASARGGVVRVRPEGDRVIISGQAVTVMQAVLLA